MSIYAFKPTWLYIKQHNTTGLKYFGKTVMKDPTKYKGSGLYWKHHLKKYGNDVTTIWCQQFFTQVALSEFSLAFSKEHNIVESNEWANLIPENGVGGAGHGFGIMLTEETKAKIAKANKGKSPWNKGLVLGSLSDDIKAKISNTQRGENNPMYGRKHSAETKAKMSLAKLKNQPG